LHEFVGIAELAPAFLPLGVFVQRYVCTGTGLYLEMPMGQEAGHSLGVFFKFLNMLVLVLAFP
jgi:hypothetical protein